MRMKQPAGRYIVKDIRDGQYSGLRKIREPYWVVDTTDNTFHSEWHSKRAADGTARDLNKEMRTK